MYEYSKLQDKYLWLKARKYVAKIKKKLTKTIMYTISKKNKYGSVIFSNVV